jgi:SAM-dependent methyltransferase
MPEPEYEYHGMMAQNWDLFRGDTSNWEDRFFFHEIIQESGQPVLDVGCGTGRLLLDYFSQGIDIDGMDNSPEMLNLCRQKAKALGLQPALFECYMETMNLPRHYQTIIVPSSSFQLVLDPLCAQKSMKRFYKHLIPGGILVMPFMLLWKRGDPLESPWRLTGEKIRSEDNTTIRRWSSSRYDPQTQLEHPRNDMKPEMQLRMNFTPLTCPGTFPATGADLYVTAGFVDICIFKEFSRLPLCRG